MKLGGSIYHGKNGRMYFGIYSYQHDVYVKLPPQFNGARHIAHYAYSTGGRAGGVDVYSLDFSVPHPSEMMNVKKEFKMQGENITVKELEDRFTGSADEHNNQRKMKRIPKKEGVTILTPEHIQDADLLYDTQIEISGHETPEVQREVVALVDADVVYFCEGDVANKFRGSRLEQVSRIIPRTTIREIEPKRVYNGGKQWFVPQCIYEANRDYGKGCIAAWVPGPNASFDGKTFTDWWGYQYGECRYPCYASNKHKCPPKTVYKFDEQKEREELMGACKVNFDNDEPLGHPVRFMRFGKRTEPWAPWSERYMVRTLEIMVDTKTRGILTTKFTPFRKDIAELLIRTHTRYMASFGDDKLEDGALLHGCGNDERLERLIKYAEAGARPVAYLMIVSDKGPSKRDLNVLEACDYGRKIWVQLLPIRFRRKDLTSEISGFTWEDLQGMGVRREDLFRDTKSHGAYERMGSELVSQDIHPFWLSLIGNNQGSIRMCHHNREYIWCGGCFQKPGIIAINRNHD